MTAVDDISHGGSSGYMRHKCRCDECKAWKSATDRVYRERMADQLRAKKRDYYLANRDRLTAKSAKWRASRTDEQRLADAEYQREWARVAYVDGRPRSAATIQRARERRAEKRDEIRAYEAAYRSANAERRRDWEAARRARIRDADVRVVPERDWRRTLARHDHRCAYCGSGGKLTQDHIIPLARGGRHSIGNLIPACGRCNSSKNDRLLIEWRAVMLAA